MSSSKTNRPAFKAGREVKLGGVTAVRSAGSAARTATPIVGHGTWKVAADELVLLNSTGDEWLLFGDPSWKDYDFCFEVLQEGFPSGISALFRSPDDTRIQHFGVGWFNHKTSVMEYAEGGNLFRSLSPLRKVLSEPIRADKWYQVRVVARGKATKAYCDKQLIFEIDDNQFDVGRVGVRTCANGRGRRAFRNLRVIAADGALLWVGPPEIGVPGG